MCLKLCHDAPPSFLGLSFDTVELFACVWIKEDFHVYAVYFAVDFIALAVVDLERDDFAAFFFELLQRLPNWGDVCAWCAGWLCKCWGCGKCQKGCDDSFFHNGYSNVLA
jgi:hypothetical protein